MSAASYEERCAALLRERCHVIDFLPRRVKAAAAPRLHRVEAHWLNSFDELGLRARITNILLKLMCCRRVEISWGGYKDNPSPAELSGAVRELMTNHSGTLSLLLPEDDALVVFECDCLSLYVYNAGGKLRKLLKRIARSEGFALRKAKK